MKKLYSLIVLAMGCFVWASCSSDDYTEVVNSVQVESAETTIAAVGGSVTIQMSGQGISAVSSASWLTTSVNGNTITATASANPMRESRAAHITVTASNGDKQLVSVVQYGLVLSLSDSEISVNGSNHELTIATETTIPVTVSTSVDWITATYDAENNVINVSIKANVDENPREGEIIVSGEGISETITITQGGIVLEVPQNEYVVSTNAANTLTITVTRSIEVQVTSDVDWLKPTFNESNSRLTVSIAASEELQREGTITLTSGALTQTITITQYGLYGKYDLIYYSPLTGGSGPGWYYTEVEFSNKGLVQNLNATDVITYPMTQSGDYEVTIGPSGSLLGRFSIYYVYLMFGNYAAGYWTGYTNTSAYATFDVLFEDGGQYIDNISGTFGSYTIDYINLQALTAASLDQANSAGVISRMVYPYMEKVPESAAQRSATRAIRTKDGHEAMPAVLSNILRPQDDKE